VRHPRASRSGRHSPVGAKPHARPRCRPPFKTEPSPAGRFSYSPLAPVSSPPAPTHQQPPSLASVSDHSPRGHRRPPEPPPSPEHRRPESPPPPRRRATASVRPRRFCLARHLPLFPRELSPLNSPHLVTRSDATYRANPTPRAWPPHGDHVVACVLRAVPEPAGPAGCWAASSGREAVTAR
jgi:hypothetical protein